MIFLLVFIGLMLIGYLMISALKNSAGFWETLSLSFLLGISYATIAMFVLELLGIRISITTILSSILICGIFLFTLRFKIVNENTKRIFSRINKKNIAVIFKSTSLVQKILTVFLFLIITFNFARTNYWPPTAYDNITGYDLMAKVLASEGTFVNSLFDENGTPIEGSAKRLVYPPMSAGSFSLAYIAELQTSKIVPALYNLFFIILFYLIIVRVLPKTTSIFLTILMFITPDFVSFSFLSSSNIIFAIFISSSILYLFSWYTFRENWMFILSGFLSASAIWTRSEAIIILGAILIVMLISFDVRKNYWRILLHVIPAIVLFFSWNLFVSTNYKVDQNVFHEALFLDIDKFQELIKLIVYLLTRTRVFGITFYLLAILFFISIPYLRKDTNFRTMTYLLLIPILMYSFLYYQMDNEEMDNLYKMITASYKRGMLAFIPVIFFYIGYNPIIRKLSLKLEEKISTLNSGTE